VQQPNQPAFLAISRYRVPVDVDFLPRVRSALATLAECPGFEYGSVGQSTDETDLLVITTRWSSVGAYRKALSRFDVKTEVVPLLSMAENESTAFEVVHERTPRGFVDAPSGRAADADTANLGSAAAPDVPPVR
jgi:heme-degrading monooxygenase HmoA